MSGPVQLCAIMALTATVSEGCITTCWVLGDRLLPLLLPVDCTVVGMSPYSTVQIPVHTALKTENRLLTEERKRTVVNTNTVPKDSPRYKNRPHCTIATG